MLTQMMAQQAHLVPAALEVLREAKLPQVRDVVEVGSPRDGGRVPYDLFEPDQGRRTRQANVEWRIEELVQDAVHAVAYTVRCVQFPRRPIPRTYKPNVVMTPSRAGRHSLALPVDVRDFGAGIVTVLVRHEMLMDEVLQQVVDKQEADFSTSSTSSNGDRCTSPTRVIDTSSFLLLHWFNMTGWP